jgi:hypothetical protein
MAVFLQPSLSGGELDPGLHGRVDLARYQISLALCRNFITKPTGGATKRSGRIFRGYPKYGDRVTRIIDFIYSTEVKYAVEMGDQYLRFWVNGSLLTNSTKTVTGISNASEGVVTAPGHGFSNWEYVLIEGVQGMDYLNNRSVQIHDVTTDTFKISASTIALAPYTGGGTVSRVVEIASPYSEDVIQDVKYTQSADVMTFTHGNIVTKQLQRTSANSFQLVDFAFKRGPFRPLNLNTAETIAASAAQGVITLTSNVDRFAPNMVGSLVYLEEQELRGVKPWASGEKNPGLGALRRSDFKVYRLSAIPSSMGSMGTPYYITGGTRPTHSTGKAFDGPQDIKDDTVNSYAVGVEWEFLHNTFGIVQITGYTDAKTVTATVLERLPDSIVGTSPTPGGSWTLSGNGSTRTFSIPGATSPSQSNYSVTVNGAPVPDNEYNPGGGGPVYCVAVESALPMGGMAGQIRRGDAMLLADPETLEPTRGVVTASTHAQELCYRIVTAGGVSLVCSATAPIPVQVGGYRTPERLLGESVAVLVDGEASWDAVADVQPLGVRAVQRITVGDRCFWAGEKVGRYILHHNAKQAL